jgi:hypothetical protein
VGEDRQTDAEWRTVALVAPFGGLGGATAWVTKYLAQATSLDFVLYKPR